MEAEILTMQVGEDGAQIKLTQEAEIIAEFVKMEATEVDLSDKLTDWLRIITDHPLKHDFKIGFKAVFEVGHQRCIRNFRKATEIP